jgi:putative ABC transport system permease protein
MELLECILTALYSLSQNKVRAFLTTLGVIIGVMSVILLVALGEAAQAYVENEFAGMGSNVIAISPGKQETTSNMIVVNAGSYRKLTTENAREIKRKGTGLKGVSGNVLGSAQVKYGNLERNCLLLGVMEDFFGIRELKLQIGRFIDAQDIDKNNKVCVIGEKIRKDLFGAKPVLNEKRSGSTWTISSSSRCPADRRCFTEARIWCSRSSPPPAARRTSRSLQDQ